MFADLSFSSCVYLYLYLYPHGQLSFPQVFPSGLPFKGNAFPAWPSRYKKQTTQFRFRSPSRGADPFNIHKLFTVDLWLYSWTRSGLKTKTKKPNPNRNLNCVFTSFCFFGISSASSSSSLCTLSLRDVLHGNSIYISRMPLFVVASLVSSTHKHVKRTAKYIYIYVYIFGLGQHTHSKHINTGKLLKKSF